MDTRPGRDEPFDLLLVSYRPLDTLAAIRFCDRTFTRHVRRRVVVFNKAESRSGVVPLPAEWEGVNGSNALGEFSAWQEGIDFLESKDVRRHPLLFVNDTVCTHRRYTSARAFAFKRELLRPGDVARLVGFADWIPGKEFVIAGMPLASWTSTFCFALSLPALELLEWRLHDSDLVAECVPGGTDEGAFFALMSDDLVAHLRHWVFGGGWYGSQPLSAANADRLQYKSRCIVAEMLLSARCQSLGVGRVDPFAENPWLRKFDRIERRYLETPYPGRIA